MADLLMEVSEDKTTIMLALPGEAEPLQMDADGLEEFMRQLSILRTTMEPAPPTGDLQDGSRLSSLPCLRWSMVVGDGGATQGRMFLLHPGFGWVWIDLDRNGGQVLVDALTRHFQAKQNEASSV